MLKKILISVVVIIVLLLGFLIAAPFIFKGKLIEIAKKELNNQLNAKVDFKDVGISIFKDFPNLTLSLHELSIVNNAPFEGDTLAAIGSFAVSVDIMSVINGDVVDIKGIFINQPDLNVRVLKDGTANYNIMKAAETEKKTTESSAVKIKLNTIQISDGNILYNDKQGDMSATLSNLNFKGNGDFTQDIFDFNTQTTIEKASVFSGSIAYLNKANLDLKLDLGVDMINSKYTFKDNTVRINALVLGLDGWLSDKKKDQYDMDLKFSAKETSFKNLLSLVPAIYLKDFDEVKTAGNLALSGFAKGSYVGEFYPAFGLLVKVDDAMFQYPGLPASVSAIFIDAKVDCPGGNLDKTVIDISKLNFKVGSEPLAMKIHIKTPISDPDIDLTAKGKIDLANVKQFYPIEAGEELAGKVEADAAMKGRLSALENEQYDKVQASGTVNIAGLKYKSKDLPEGIVADKIAVVFTSKKGTTPAAASLPIIGYGSLDIQNLKYADKTLPGGKVDISSMFVTLNENDAALERLNAKVGKSDFALSGKLDNLLGYLLSDGTLSGNLNLKSNQIDANEWMTTETTTAETYSASTSTESAAIPANLNLDFTASVTKVLYDKMQLNNVAGQATIKDETFTLRSLTASALGGSALINGKYSTKEVGLPKIDFGYDIKNIDIKQAYTAIGTTEQIAPIFKYMNGKFSSTLNMKGALLEDLSLDMKTLLANGRVDINQATITGFDVLTNIADRFKIKELKNVNISDAWTVFEVVNGRIAVEPFDINLNNIKMNVGGSHGIDNSVDYDVLMDVPKNLLGGAGNLVNDLLAKNPIPGFSAGNLPDLTKFKVKVTNTLSDPKLAFSMVGGSGISVKEQMIENVKEQVQEIKEDVSAAAKAQADKIVAEAKKQAQVVRDEGKKLADKTKKEGYAAAKRLEDEAKNPIAKAAAKPAAEKLRKEADNSANKINKEANDKANKIEQEAQKRANDVLEKSKLN
ncbi:MAG: AsmA-like C-terminal region-containing protein [Chitinophagales bacterium]|nr:AsmA-like C-terminal region-containing protein [Chitinophagales bacterium]